MSKETAAFAATSPAETEWVTLLQDNTRAGGQGAPPIAPPSRARWQARIGGSIRSAPVLHGSTLYAASLLGKEHLCRLRRWTRSQSQCGNREDAVERVDRKRH